MVGAGSMVDSFQKYIQYEKRLSAHTVLAYKSDLDQFNSFITENYPDHNLETADFGVVRAWIIQLVDNGVEPPSVNRKIACLRSFYKFLMRQEVISKDPMLKVKVLKTKKKLPSFVKEGDMVNMLDNQIADDSLE